MDYTNGQRGVFKIDNCPIVYAGIGGIIHLLRSLKETQDLGHPLFNNIRDGDWIMDYIIQRFNDNKHTKFLVKILEEIFQKVKELPNRAKPHYFSKVVNSLWDELIIDQLKNLSSDSFKWITQDPFTIHLFESVSQFYGKINSAKF